MVVAFEGMVAYMVDYTLVAQTFAVVERLVVVADRISAVVADTSEGKPFAPFAVGTFVESFVVADCMPLVEPFQLHNDVVVLSTGFEPFFAHPLVTLIHVEQFV